jgi:hypothetical protein
MPDIYTCRTGQNDQRSWGQLFSMLFRENKARPTKSGKKIIRQKSELN